MVHDHAPAVSCVPYSPGGWFIPLATTQLSGDPAIHGSRQPEIRNVALGERLGRVVAANVSDSGAVVVGASVVGWVGTEVAVVVGDAVVVGAVAVVVVGGAVVVVGAEVAGEVVVGAAAVVVGATAVVVAGGISSAGSLAVAKVVGDGSSAVVVVVAVDAGDVSGSSAEVAST